MRQPIPLVCSCVRLVWVAKLGLSDLRFSNSIAHTKEGRGVWDGSHRFREEAEGDLPKMESVPSLNKEESKLRSSFPVSFSLFPSYLCLCTLLSLWGWRVGPVLVDPNPSIRGAIASLLLVLVDFVMISKSDSLLQESDTGSQRKSSSTASRA